MAGTAIPDAQSVQMGEGGELRRRSAEVEQSSQTIDLRGTGARENVEEVLRKHGIDPDKEGQTVDATTRAGPAEGDPRARSACRALKIPNAEGFGGGISPPKVDPLAQIEYLATKRDAGEITDAEFEAQKRKLLGSGERLAAAQRARLPDLAHAGEVPQAAAGAQLAGQRPPWPGSRPASRSRSTGPGRVSRVRSASGATPGSARARAVVEPDVPGVGVGELPLDRHRAVDRARSRPSARRRRSRSPGPRGSPARSGSARRARRP